MPRLDPLQQAALEVLFRSSDCGYQIAQSIKQSNPRLLVESEIAIYPALHGLEGLGLIESYERLISGKTRRFYRITESGIRAVGSVEANTKPVRRIALLPIQEAT